MCALQKNVTEFLVLYGLTIVLSSPVFSEESYSPYAEKTYPTNVYWGDTHLHTKLSFDAYSYGGNRTLGPEEAYRFAKGSVVTTHSGKKVRLRRPLDFLVIADHAENMGVMEGLELENPDVLTTEVGSRLSRIIKEADSLAITDFEKSQDLYGKVFFEVLSKNLFKNDEYGRSVWSKVISFAEKHNAPGKFTTLIGYEWSSLTFNLHRVVIFKDGIDKVGKTFPFSQYDSQNPEALWSYFDSYSQKTGGDVLAIPHNANLSRGVMFALEDADGNPISKDYAKTRSRWEPLLEVTQIKGDSETHPVLSPNDEFANYETFNYPRLAPDAIAETHRINGYYDYTTWFDDKNEQQENADWQRPYEYARSALKLGLGQHAKLGVNPFKFGMIGSTDSHSSLSTADEDNFFGKFTLTEPHKDRVLGSWTRAKSDVRMGWRMNAAGYAAVWAEENTRDSLFVAMKRKEVYATTGPRIKVRFFGGWEYSIDDAFRPDIAKIGYNKGVPMGGDLTNAPKGKSPSFLIRAVKDPDGANLDRIQVIKGWHDKHGELHEKVYNVALSDNRKKTWRGKVEPVGNTVDVKDASYTNSIGDPELTVVWTDPNFDPDELAFYYVRVLEIPTPRWTAYDAKFFAIKDIPDEVPMVTQERAYTSAIWYSPAE